MVICAEAFDEVIIAAFKKAGFKAYTGMSGLMGEGEESESKLGTHYWLGKNNALLLRYTIKKLMRFVRIGEKIKS